MLPSLLARQVTRGLRQFLTTGFEPSNPFFKDLISRFTQDQAQFTKGPYLSCGLPFLPGDVANDFFETFTTPFPPYLHQQQAWQRLSSQRDARSTIVATGTGSGKTECFLYPILDHCARHPSDGIQAIIVYPMNALATDQARRFAAQIAEHPRFAHLTAGLFVGEDRESSDADPKPGTTAMSQREVINCQDHMRAHPPNILLTNYKMLDYLLMRPKNRELWKHNGGGTLRYLVVDELHTFDGAQGTDLACLIRRLKGRLGIGDGELLCVGTSATLGGGVAAGDQLRRYAADIFGEPFDDQAIISEQRQSAAAFLGSHFDARYLDLAALSRSMDPDGYLSPQHYLQEQFNLLIHNGPTQSKVSLAEVDNPDWRCELGRLLKNNVSFKKMVTALEGGPLDYQELVQILAVQFPHDARPHVPALLDALCALAAWARDPEQKGLTAQPLLHLRLHLWLRELRRMVSQVTVRHSEQDPVGPMTFSDDVGEEKGKIFLPLVQCRDCHTSAWVSMKPKSQAQLVTDLHQIYKRFFARHPDVVYLLPLLDGEEHPSGSRGLEQHLCARCGWLQTRSGACAGCGHTGLQRVFVPALLRERQRQGEIHAESENRCAGCGGGDTLQIFGARATHLTSVAISHMFGTAYNDDKKLITFSDSVQDATHRAGFFGARTWRSCIRAALAQAIAASGPITLAALRQHLRTFWLDGRDNPHAMDRLKAVVTFFPPGLTWMDDYLLLKETGIIPEAAPGKRSLEELLVSRLTYEAAEELGLRSRRGRTLVHTGCAAMGPRPELLAQAAAAALPGLRQHLGLRHLNPQQLLWFMAGICLRLQLRGGIALEELEHHLLHESNTFTWNRFQFWLPKYPDWSAGPSFLTNASKGHHDRLGGKQGWQYKWLERTMLGDAATIEGFQGAEGEIWMIVLSELVAVGLLRVEQRQKDQYWALQPDALIVSPKVSQLQTPGERHNLWVPEALAPLLEGMASLQHSDPGCYQPVPQRDHWLGDIYRKGQIHRVFSDEHTGLLSREARERVEKDFIDRPNPWSANLLSCTPTLEMGIDIGDLSTVVLCSVPPRGDNFQQRVGRAGRKDGNAFTLTVANGRPHDLYFYADPLTMIAGQVEPPGVFLNAGSVIQRQLMAFCLDRMVAEGRLLERPAGARRDKTPAMGEILPHQLKEAVARVAKRGLRARKVDDWGNDGFPYNFLYFVGKNQERLLHGFFDLFGDALNQRTRAGLASFLTAEPDGQSAMERTLLERLDEVALELKTREVQMINLKKAIERVEKLPVDEVRNQTLADLNNERAGLSKVRRDLGHKMLLNFLTDEGLLPNYAFPEAGVKLRSVIVMGRKRGEQDAAKKGEGKQDERVRTFDYERPASSAISELAPDNHFYAGGRRVRIQRVDLKLSPVESWRLCSRCNHGENENDAKSQECPVCGDASFGDVGARKIMIKLRAVMARTSDRESQVMDDKEEREFKFYTRQMLLSFKAYDKEVAWQVHRETTLFGFEYLRKATFREINFGEADEDSPVGLVAGEARPRPGFRICGECHQVLARRGEVTHAPFCRSKPSSGIGVVEGLYLYRELTSEALRIMLPSGRPEQEKLMPTFVAVLQLGMRMRFGGQVSHLRVTEYREPIGDSREYRQYLVLYDTVPGGTGYLHHLLRSREGLKEVFEGALTVLKACPCGASAEKDGCYRCLYYYRQSNELSKISRRLAMAELELLLGLWQHVEEVSTLSLLEPLQRYDSPLEELFPLALGKFAANGKVAGRSLAVRVVPTHFLDCDNGFLLQVENHYYNMAVHPRKNPRDGTAFACEPDFLIWSAREHANFVPIAVFMDGFKYHGQVSTFNDDTQKRMSLLAGGKFRVWTFNWQDMQMDFSKPREAGRNLFAEGKRASMAQFQNTLIERWQLGPKSRLYLEPALNQLLAFLAEPDEAVWQKLVFHGALSWFGPDFQDPARLGDFAQQVQKLVPLPLWEIWCNIAQEGQFHGGITDTELWPKVACVLPPNAVKQLDPRQMLAVLWLDPKVIAGEAGEAAWQAFWRAANLLQFLPLFAVVSPESAAKGNYETLPYDRAAALFQKGTELSGIWQEALTSEADPLHLPALKQLAKRGWTPPVFGHELVDHQGAVIGECEMAWPLKKVALFYPSALPLGDSVWQQRGWRVLALDETGSWVEALAAAVPAVTLLSDAWRVALEQQADEDYVPALRELAAQEYLPPEFGYELCDAMGAVVGECEMAWPAQKLALLLPAHLAEQGQLWRKQGWRVYPLDKQGQWLQWLAE